MGYRRVDVQDLIGAKVGRLTVLSFAGKQPYLRKDGKRLRDDYWYECVCECGLLTRVQRLRLVTLAVRSCGCLQIQNTSGETNPYWTGCGEISGNWWNGVKQNARARGLPFLVSPEEGWALFLAQGRRCALTGTKLSFTPKATTASLDRIDSNLGYVTGNIQWLHKTINQMKNGLPQSRFLEICQEVTQYSGSVTVQDKVEIVVHPHNRNWRGCGGVSGQLWGVIVTKAADRGIPVLSTIQDCWEVFVQQGGRCALTGEVIDLTIPRRCKSQRTASLDRIDNCKPYMVGNLQWVHKDVNRLKYVFSMSEVKEWCRAVATYSKASRLTIATDCVDGTQGG